MPAVLREHQHEISSLDGARALVFGTEDTGYLTLSRPVHQGGDVREADGERPQEDGVMFGRDYAGGKSVTYEIGVLTDAQNLLGVDDPHRSNLDALDVIEGWWRDRRLRDKPSAMAVLRSCEAGQTWRCYGRPRGYEESAGKLTASGYTPIVCRFNLIDDRWYSDTVEETEAPLQPSTEGGIVFPLVSVGTFLFSSVAETAGHTVAVITGARETWPWVEFQGPSLNPSVTIGDTFVGLNARLLDGDSITVDPRPWKRTVLRGDGANFAGSLNPKTPPLRDLLLDPGTYDVQYRATDATGSSRAIVRWRQARNRP